MTELDECQASFNQWALKIHPLYAPPLDYDYIGAVIKAWETALTCHTQPRRILLCAKGELLCQLDDLNT